MLRRALTWLSRHGYLLAVLAIALSTALFLPGRDTFAKGQWALLYLLHRRAGGRRQRRRPGGAGGGPGLLCLGLLLPAALPHAARARPQGLAVARRLPGGRGGHGRPDRPHARPRGAGPGPRARDGRPQPALGEPRLAGLDRDDGRDHPGRDRRLARRRVGDAVRRRRRRAHHLLRHAAVRRTRQRHGHGGPLGLRARRTGRPARTDGRGDSAETRRPSEGVQGAGGQRRRLSAAAQPDGRRRRPQRGRQGGPARLRRRRRPPAGLACQPGRDLPRTPATAGGGDGRPRRCARPTGSSRACCRRSRTS